MIDLVAVGAGGFLGAAGRYLLGRAVNGIWRGDFPAGTFLVNLLGSFALGVLVAHPYLAGQIMDGSIRVALGIGFLGSFTTYSTLMYESFTLHAGGKTWLAFFYVMGSIISGLLLAWLGLGLLIK